MSIDDRPDGCARCRGSAIASSALLVIAGFALSACGGAPAIDVGTTESALFGGTEVTRCEWTNVVSLQGSCSGIAVHPQLVLYAAHCGVDFARVSAEAQEAEIDHCAMYPGATLGATDLAYCKLKTRLVVDVVPPAMGCESRMETPGASALMIGYGPATEDGQFGVRRASTGVIESLDDSEIIVGGPGVGLCSGDSGGPLFVQVDDGGNPSYRLVGVASATPRGPCGEAESHYVRLQGYWSWLEEQTGLDLTPCGGSDGSWAPTAACTASRPKTSACEERRGDDLSRSCGEAFQTDVPDRQAPSISIRAPGENERMKLGAAVHVSVDANDSGWGLSEVRVKILDAHSRLVWSDVRSFPPYEFDAGPLDVGGSYRLEAGAFDHAGLSTTAEARFDLDGGGASSCALARRRSGAPASFCCTLILGCLAARRKRR